MNKCDAREAIEDSINLTKNLQREYLHQLQNEVAEAKAIVDDLEREIAGLMEMDTG